MNIFVAINYLSFNHNAISTITTHSTLEEAKSAIHFRLQCDRETTLTWKEIYDGNEHNPRVIYYNTDGAQIFITKLGDMY